ASRPRIGARRADEPPIPNPQPLPQRRERKVKTSTFALRCPTLAGAPGDSHRRAACLGLGCRVVGIDQRVVFGKGVREGPSMPETRLGARRLAWIVGLSVLTVGLGLGRAGRLTYHEAFVAQAAREMIARGDVLVPTMGGRPWL